MAGQAAAAAGLTIEPAGALPWLWGVTFVLANLFSFFWLGKAALNALPGATYKLKTTARKLGVGRGSTSDSGSDGGAAGAKTEGAAVADPGPAAPPVQLEWRDMSFSVMAFAGRKQLLQEIYGQANPCELHGLLGPSGAGKTTLMDLLTLRISHGGGGGSHGGGSHGGAAEDAASDGSGGGSAATSAVGGRGQLLVNGRAVAPAEFSALVTYVPQHDHLVPVLTAQESVQFDASLKLPPGTSPAARGARVARVLDIMGLAGQHSRLVGGALPGGLVVPGISGSERKQLAIACGVVAGPRVVMLDEPTSGLDSCSALSVVLFLKNMATKEGSTVLASLHQPRAVLWGQLDMVTLLAGGRLMFTGPPGGLVPWFESLGYLYDPVTHGVVPDWALDLVSIGFSDAVEAVSSACSSPRSDAAVRRRVSGGSDGDSAGASPSAAAAAREGIRTQAELTAAADAFLLELQRRSPEWFAAAAGSASSGSLQAAPPGEQQQQQQLADGGWDAERQGDAPRRQDQGAAAARQPRWRGGGASAGVAPEPAASDVQHLQPPRASAFSAYRALLWRELLITTRNPLDVGGRMLTFAYVSLLWGIATYSLPGTADTILGRMLACYAVTAFFMLVPFVFMSMFTQDKGLFAADVAERLYRPVLYFFAKMTVAMPFNALLALAFFLVYYGMVGLRQGAATIASSCVIAVLAGLISMQAIYACAVIASSQDLAFVYAIAFTAVNLVVNASMLQFDQYSLGWGMSWLRFLSPANFAWEALVTLELEGRGFDCSQGSGIRAIGLIPELMPDSTPALSLIKGRVEHLGPGCVASGDAVLEMYTQGLTFGQTVAVLLGYFAVLLAVSFLGLYRSARRKA